MSSLAIASVLIQDQEYEAARDVLERAEGTAEEQHKLSLLYRYLHEFDKEEALVRRALEVDPAWAYMRERAEWHARPLFHPDVSKSKVVPRPPLHLEREGAPPPQEVLEQMCFVTAGGSDHPYFMLLIENLEALSSTRHYKDVPICIINAGLDDADVDYLLTRFPAIKTIKDPGWDYPIDASMIRNNPNAGKACTARNHIPKHFPGYRYYLWMDTDLWIQDERYVDVYVYTMLEHGIGIGHCSNFDDYKDNFYFANYPVPESYRKLALEKKRYPMASFFGIDVQSGMFELWTKYVDELAQPTYKWGIDEHSLIQAFYHYKPNVPILRGIFSSFRAGLPKADDADVLYRPDTDEAIDIVNLTGWQVVKHQHLFPMAPLSGQIDIQKNKNDFLMIHERFRNDRQAPQAQPGKRMASLHYRVFAKERVWKLN